MYYDVSDVKITTSMTHKGKVAPSGLVFFIAKVKDKKSHMEYSIHELVNRNGAEPKVIGEFEFSMKKRLVSLIEEKRKP